MIVVELLHARGGKRAELKMGPGFALDITFRHFSRPVEILSIQVHAII
jgi:hypothetical protein